MRIRPKSQKDIAESARRTEALLYERVGISFCSSPGCGYPDGKPCINCGAVVPKSNNVLIHGDNDFSMMTARLVRAIRHGNAESILRLADKAEELLIKHGRMSSSRSTGRTS